MISLKKKLGRPSLTTVQKDQIRDQIIQIARDLFINEGYEQTSMRKIAAHAGFTPTKIYYYFDNKKQLLKHFWRNISCDMWEYTRPDDSLLSGPPLSIIRHIMRNSIDYWVANPKNYQLFIETQDFKAANAENFDFYNTPGSKDYIMTLKYAVERCMQEDIFEKDDVLFICQLITSSIYGVYGSFYSLPTIAWVNKERLIACSIDNTLKGLQK